MADTTAAQHPSRYAGDGSVECIDAIRSALGDGFVDYCIGSAIKYLWRCRRKGGVNDLDKCADYLMWARESMGGGDVVRDVYVRTRGNDSIPFRSLAEAILGDATDGGGADE